MPPKVPSNSSDDDTRGNDDTHGNRPPIREPLTVLGDVRELHADRSQLLLEKADYVHQIRILTTSHAAMCERTRVAENSIAAAQAEAASIRNTLAIEHEALATGFRQLALMRATTDKSVCNFESKGFVDKISSLERERSLDRVELRKTAHVRRTLETVS